MTDRQSPAGIQPDIDLDLRGLNCPLPVLKLRKATKNLNAGLIIKVLATDPMSKIDIPHFCAAAGHILIDSDELADQLIYIIKTAPK